MENEIEFESSNNSTDSIISDNKDNVSISDITKRNCTKVLKVNINQTWRYYFFRNERNNQDYTITDESMFYKVFYTRKQLQVLDYDLSTDTLQNIDMINNVANQQSKFSIGNDEDEEQDDKDNNNKKSKEYLKKQVLKKKTLIQWKYKAKYFDQIYCHEIVTKSDKEMKWKIYENKIKEFLKLFANQNRHVKLLDELDYVFIIYVFVNTDNNGVLKNINANTGNSIYMDDFAIQILDNKTIQKFKLVNINNAGINGNNGNQIKIKHNKSKHKTNKRTKKTKKGNYSNCNSNDLLDSDNSDEDIRRLEEELKKNINSDSQLDDNDNSKKENNEEEEEESSGDSEEHEEHLVSDTEDNDDFGSNKKSFSDDYKQVDLLSNINGRFNRVCLAFKYGLCCCIFNSNDDYN
jgi:hypothetical protein